MIQSHRNISQQLRSIVDRELEPGESVKWIGQPTPHFFTIESTILFFFGISWTTFALFLQFKAWQHSLNIPFIPFGIPFVLISLGFLSNPLFTYLRSFKTVYVITDKRAVKITGKWLTTVRSYTPNTFREIYRKERKDGTGDVVISIKSSHDFIRDRRPEELVFLRVNSPKEIEHILKQLVEQTAPSNP